MDRDILEHAMSSRGAGLQVRVVCGDITSSDL